MDFLDDIFALLDSDEDNDSIVDSYLGIAQEAEDITGQAARDAASATGKTEEAKKGDIDLNTNDILGTKTPEKEEDNNDDNPGDNEADPNGNQGNDEPQDEVNTDSPEEPQDDGNDQMDDQMTEMSDPFEASRKKKLWVQFETLYKSLTDSITLISKYVPNISDATTIKALDNIRENLIDGKEYAYRILTTEYRTISYPEMEKRYIGLNHIYDICTNELEAYFEKYKKDK